jgi:hypothetical protein
MFWKCHWSNSIQLLQKLINIYSEIPSLLQHVEDHYRIHMSPHWSSSWARRIQSTSSRPISFRSILILSCHLLLGLASGISHSGFHIRTLYSRLFTPIRVTCPAMLTIPGLARSMKLFVMQSSAAFSYFISLRTIYPLQQLVLKSPQTLFVFQRERLCRGFV